MKKVVFIILSLCALVSCQQIQRDLTRNAVLEMNGNYLYLDEIEQVIPTNLSVADSAKYAESYKKQWIISNLMYQKAKENVGKSKEIDKLTEIYKRELIINKYQQQLILEKLQQIPEDSLVALYEKRKESFLLKTPLIKGIFIQVHSSAQGQDSLSRLLSDINDENLEPIMRYCTGNALDYEFFIDNWTDYSEVIKSLPNKIESTDPILSRGTVVQQSEENNYYLKVIGLCKAGEPSPYELIKGELYNILLNKEKIQFITDFRQELYNEAIENGAVHFYENEE
jgi:hypothetical protein